MIQELSMIVPIVLGTVVLRVIRRCESGDLVSIRGVESEESFDFVSHGRTTAAVPVVTSNYSAK